MENFIQSLTDWFFAGGIKIALILIIAFLIKRIGKKFIERAITKSVKDRTKEATEKRQKTLVLIFGGVLKVLIWLIATMMILSELGVDIGPVLAGAGILGVALGFGAQYVVRDFLAGLFVIIENQYRVGDVVCLDGTCGLVEDIDLRKTILRDLDGVVHYVPNGEAKKASNMSKGFARVNLNINIAYDSDLEKVIDVINGVGNKLAEDHQWKDGIIKAPQFLRVDNFSESAMTVKVLGETRPLKQWEIAGELRKRLKIAFDKAGIEIPFPQVSVWQKENKKLKKK